jgi:hypothetical protein
MPDKNMYLYFGGLNKDSVMIEQSEVERREQEEREREEIQKQSLYYRQDYLRMKKANTADHVYIYDPVRNKWRRIRCVGKLPSKRTHHQGFYRG